MCFSHAVMLNTTCEELFSSPYLNRFVSSHTLYPFALVYLFNLSVPYAVLLAYVWETVEIAIMDMCIRHHTTEAVVDSLLLDPLAALLGGLTAALMIWILKEPPTEYWTNFSKKWPVVILALIVIVPGSLIPWYVEDHKLATGSFGLYWFIFFNLWMVYTKPKDIKVVWLPAAYILLLTLTLTFSEKFNTHLANISVHAAIYFVLICWKVWTLRKSTEVQLSSRFLVK